MSLPSARTHVHGVTGKVERAGASARFVARRAGAWSLGLAKVLLWLLVVTSSLITIGTLTALAHYHRAQLASSMREQPQPASHLRRLELARRAIAIDASAPSAQASRSSSPSSR